MLKQSLYALAGAAVIGTSFVGSAEANGPSAMTCDVSNFTESIACEGAFSGNATPDIPGNTYFGISDWTEVFKVDSDSGTDGDLTVTGGGTSGGYSITGLDAGHQYMAALKGGPTFSVYLLEAGITSVMGDWNTDGILKGNGQPGPGLSNFTVWKTRVDDHGGGEKIPEPAAMAGLVAVGAGIVVNRRKKSQEA